MPLSFRAVLVTCLVVALGRDGVPVAAHTHGAASVTSLGSARSVTQVQSVSPTQGVARVQSVARAQRGAPGQLVTEAPDIRLFFETMSDDDDQAEAALELIGAAWRPGYTALLWDLVRMMRPPPRPAPTLSFSRPSGFDRGAAAQLPPPEHPSTRVWRRLIRFLDDRIDERLGRGEQDLTTLQHWMWARPYELHPDYTEFKRLWYGNIDPAFQDFFVPGTQATIRLDEIDYGGVSVNGIPPLAYPPHVDAEAGDADYLDDDHVVFGIAIDGIARAYPKRILAWHEMAHDRIGDVELTIVYCTLCGTVIPYESVVDGRHITFGTSGLLYRSNKLMFDHETKSLWNTFEGVPVVGPLAAADASRRPQLRYRPVVTTTWEEWQRKHPNTTVLTLDTGYERDYREGAAYRDYFSSDDLMFQVPRLDDRLDTKDEVFVMLPTDAAGVRHPLAIDVEYLEDHRVFQTDQADRQFVVVTSREGANRAYEAAAYQFEGLVSDSDDDEGLQVRASDGSIWQVGEDALVRDDETARLPRFPAHRAFWFGWYAQFPETTLIK